MLSELFIGLTSGWNEVFPTRPSDEQVRLFERYAELLVEWNEHINLTAITDAEGIVTKHFLDSLSILPLLDEVAEEEFTLIDVGTGAGFPGMALAIIRPDWQITLLEGTRKKVDFISLVVRELGLDHITPVWGRAEEQGRSPTHREQYDAAVARAVAELPILAEYALPFVRVGGRWIAQKGPRVEEEAQNARNALGQLGGHLLRIETIEVPGLTEERRTAVVIEKRKSTPATFPRRPGVPGKRPL